MRRTFIQGTAIAIALIWTAACAHTDRMVAARQAAEQFAHSQEKPVLDLPVDYDDADLVRFVGDDRLLIGSADVDRYGGPVFGPLILYDIAARRELWRVDRKRAPGASFDIVSTSPQVVLQTTVGDDTRYQSFDPATGKERWSRSSERQCLQRFEMSGSSGLAALYELCGDELTRISAADGRDVWKTKTGTFDKSVPRQLRLSGDRVLVVDNAQVTAFLAKDGAKAWEVPQGVGHPFDAILGGGGLVVYGPRNAVELSLADGRALWRWSTTRGTIRLVSSTEHRALAVVQAPDLRADTLMLLTGTNAREAGTVALGGFLASPLVVHGDRVLMTVGALAEQTFGMVNAPEMRLVYTRKRTLVGVSLATGKEVLRKELPTVGDPATWSELSGPPDGLEVRGNRLLLVRADHGVTAVDMDSGAIVWERRHDRLSETYQESLFKLSFSNPAAGRSYRVGGGNSLVSAMPSRPLGVTQSFNEARREEAKRVLSDPHASADKRASARTDIHIAAASDMALTQIQTSFGQMQAGADVAMSLLSLGAAFQQAWKLEGQRGLVGIYHAALLDVQEATRRHGMALSRSTYVEPGPIAVSLVDLETGRRARLQLGPGVEGARARMRSADLSPSGKRLAAVAIGRDAAHYIARERFGLILPASSVLVYDVGHLDFRDEAPPPAAPATPAAAPTLFARSLGALVLAADYEAVRSELAKGASVDALHFGVTPLMFAVSTGRVELVTLLLAYGADVKAKNTINGKTAYDELPNVRDEARRNEIRRLLDAAASGQRPPKPH